MLSDKPMTTARIAAYITCPIRFVLAAAILSLLCVLWLIYLVTLAVLCPSQIGEVNYGCVDTARDLINWVYDPF